MTDLLLRDIERFIGDHGLAESRFGRDAVNDTTFIPQLREGREVRRRTEARVRLFMASYVPAADQTEAPSCGDCAEAHVP